MAATANSNRDLVLTLCILMDFPIQIKAIRMWLSIINILRGHRSELLNYDVFLSLRIVCT